MPKKSVEKQVEDMTLRMTGRLTEGEPPWFRVFKKRGVVARNKAKLAALESILELKSVMQSLVKEAAAGEAGALEESLLGPWRHGVGLGAKLAAGEEISAEEVSKLRLFLEELQEELGETVPPGFFSRIFSRLETVSGPREGNDLVDALRNLKKRISRAAKTMRATKPSPSTRPEQLNSLAEVLEIIKRGEGGIEEIGEAFRLCRELSHPKYLALEWLALEVQKMMDEALETAHGKTLFQKWEELQRREEEKQEKALEEQRRELVESLRGLKDLFRSGGEEPETPTEE